MDCPICGGAHHVLDCPEVSGAELSEDTVWGDPSAVARELDLSLADEEER